MVKYRFLRLVRKPQIGAGRRYYRLLSYPHDCGEFNSLEEATAYAVQHKYEAMLGPGHTWIALTDKARQCIRWHEAGKEGYIDVQ